MKKIYVFTSTGNSLHLARILARELEECEILSIPRLMEESEWTIDGDAAGFIFPCYYGTVPQIVSRFIRGAADITGRKFFAMISAGRSTGLAMEHLRELLEERGKSLHYGRSLTMVSNYMNGWYYSAVMPARKKISRLQDQADRTVSAAAADILAGKNSVDRGSRGNYLLPRILSPGRYVEDTRPWDSEFSISGNCTGCGNCARACPVDNIRLQDGRPEFSGNCQRCMGCIQFCPSSAIQIQGKVMNKRKYVHRDITLKDLTAFHRGEASG